MQASPHRGAVQSGDPKQSDPTPELPFQGLADITNQAAILHAGKAQAQNQMPHADSLPTIQLSTGRGSDSPQHDPQQTPQQYSQASSTGNSSSTSLAFIHRSKPAAIPSRSSPARDAARQADQAASHAASTMQASLLSQDHVESLQQQQQRLVDSNLNLPRIVGLSSTLCLLDLPDLKGFQGKDGKLALAAERVICTRYTPYIPTSSSDGRNVLCDD